MGVSSLRISNVCDDNCLGFEVPNKSFQTVDLEKILDSDEFRTYKAELPINLGVLIDGTPIFADLAKMPHLLVAGATGSGKSVGLNAFILSLMAHRTPDELRFVLIDPKRIEFSIYNNQRYMYTPVVTDNSQASQLLEYLVLEMNRRYGLFEETRVKNLKEYHQTGRTLPYIVAIVDEFSDLVLSDKSVEKQIQILAQKARAAGIHLILATQRPSVDVVTGSIKANFPSRIAFKTASGTDSKTILDTTGAENLVGRGDALYLATDGQLIRFHGGYIENAQIERRLQPYRCEVKPLAVMKEYAPKEQPQSADQAKSKTAKKQTFFLIAWLIALWKYIGKRNQKKILNFVLQAVFGKKIKF
jgi:S-DNA-T family DNA segregation ATPase FtsK/SpoIIIE